MSKRRRETATHGAGQPIGAPAANGGADGATVTDPIEAAHQAQVARGEQYDNTMTAVHNGIEAARAAKGKTPRDPNAPRAVFIILGDNENGDLGDVISTHKTLRRAVKWLADQRGLIGRLYKQTTIYRAKKVG